MNEFSHFILTPYNVGIYSRSNIDAAAWMERRKELFQRYCVSSIRFQTIQNFHWIVIVDEATPDISFLQSVPCTIVKTNDCLLERRVEVIRTITSLTTTKWVITTRVDNDDALARHFVETVQRNFEPKHRLCLEFPSVYFYEHRKGKLACGFYRENTTLSLIEEREKIATVFLSPHPTIHRVARVRDLASENGMSMMVTHGDNLRNIFMGYRVRNKQGFLENFPFMTGMVRSGPTRADQCLFFGVSLFRKLRSLCNRCIGR